MNQPGGGIESFIYPRSWFGRVKVSDLRACQDPARSVQCPGAKRVHDRQGSHEGIISRMTIPVSPTRRSGQKIIEELRAEKHPTRGRSGPLGRYHVTRIVSYVPRSTSTDLRRAHGQVVLTVFLSFSFLLQSSLELPLDTTLTSRVLCVVPGENQTQLWPS